MKKTKIIMLMLALICGIGTVHAEKGQSAVGFNLLYGNGSKGISNFGIGVKYDYSFSDALRAEPSFDYYFDNDKIGKMMSANVNFHYLFNLDSDQKFHLYPIFGFTTLLGKEKDKLVYEKDGITPVKNADGSPKLEDDHFFRFGCNLGVGFQYDITDDFGLVVESKYKLVKDFGQVDFSVGCVVLF